MSDSIIPKNIWVDSRAGVTDLLIDILSQPKDTRLFMDIEGVNLGRHGTMSIIQLYIVELKKVFLIDIHVLEARAFDTPAADFWGAPITLKDILEQTTYTKVLFDLRTDSDALFGLFDIRLRGVEDVQAMLFAHCPKPFLSGLAKCIEAHAGLDEQTMGQWKATKENGRKVFKNGDYAQFNVRPLSQALQEYCTNDVVWLPRLRDAYWTRLLEKPSRKKQAIFETERRVAASQGPVQAKTSARGPIEDTTDSQDHWDELGTEEYPSPVRELNEPARPFCDSNICGRYQGYRHHCDESCACYTTCCRWWVERTPPEYNAEGEMIVRPGPKWTRRWGYQIPERNLLGRFFPVTVWTPEGPIECRNPEWPRGRGSRYPTVEDVIRCQLSKKIWSDGKAFAEPVPFHLSPRGKHLLAAAAGLQRKRTAYDCNIAAANSDSDNRSDAESTSDNGSDYSSDTGSGYESGFASWPSSDTNTDASSPSPCCSSNPFSSPSSEKQGWISSAWDNKAGVESLKLTLLRSEPAVLERMGSADDIRKANDVKTAWP